MNASEIKKAAREFGADLAGIAPVGRLDHLPERNHPKTLSPRVKSVIVVGHRIMRGTLRGVEEGTNFGSTYGAYGYQWMEDLFLSRTVYQLACLLEEQGIEAIPVMAYQDASDAFVPDYKAYAKAAGLGDVGKGGFFLTPQYGHRQRLAMIFADIELEGDDLQTLSLCDGCRACLEACPLDAMKYGESFEIDEVLCAQCRNGARCEGKRSDRVDRYAASCGRGCLVALEKKIGEQFEHKFRKRSVWSLGFAAQEKAK